MKNVMLDVGETALNLRELVAAHGPSARIILRDGDQVVGTLRLRPRDARTTPVKRVIGLHRGNVLHMAEDVDAPLPDEFWLGEDR